MISRASEDKKSKNVTEIKYQCSNRNLMSRKNIVKKLNVDDMQPKEKLKYPKTLRM